MKRYYVDGKEITQEQAKIIEQKNNEYMASADLNDWLKIKFITVI